MIEVANDMIAPCGTKERSRMEMYVEQINGIRHYSNWNVLRDIETEIARQYPNQCKIIDAAHHKAMAFYHEEEFYAGLL